MRVLSVNESIEKVGEDSDLARNVLLTHAADNTLTDNLGKSRRWLKYTLDDNSSMRDRQKI